MDFRDERKEYTCWRHPQWIIRNVLKTISAPATSFFRDYENLSWQLSPSRLERALPSEWSFRTFDILQSKIQDNETCDQHPAGESWNDCREIILTDNYLSRFNMKLIKPIRDSSSLGQLYLLVLYKCKVWSAILREGHRVRVFENRVMNIVVTSEVQGVQMSLQYFST